MSACPDAPDGPRAPTAADPAGSANPVDPARSAPVDATRSADPAGSGDPARSAAPGDSTGSGDPAGLVHRARSAAPVAPDRPQAAWRPPRWAWPLALVALAALALGLRLWGIAGGLPYVYNVDEQAHFVPHAIGIFGHDWNPHYFVNPPAFTYLLHVVLFAWFGGGDAVARSYAIDPTDVFVVARATSAVLGAASVVLLAVAGARLLGRRAGLVAGALLAVAFLPVFYAHLALNDAPAVAAVTLALAGAAGVLRHGRWRDLLVAGVGVGLAAATKYTAGIVVLALIAAVLLGPGRRGRRRAAALALGLGAALAAFLVANPYAVLDFPSFWHGIARQSSATSSVEKLGNRHDNGWRFYLWVATWGLGWAPAIAAAGGALALLARRGERAVAALLLPTVALFWLFMGSQERFYGRWLLPIVPILCLLAAWAAVRAADLLTARLTHPRRWSAAALAVIAAGVGAQGLVHAVHVDRLLSRPDTRAVTRAWMDAHIPAGARIVLEPVAADGWLADPSPRARFGGGDRWVDVLSRDEPVGTRVHGGLNRRLTLEKWIGGRRLLRLRRSAGVVGGEGYERTTFPGLIGQYERKGVCWVISGSTESGRAFAEPEKVPRAIAYYRALERRARVAFRIRPERSGAATVPFDFDWSFDGYPLAYERFGPAMTVYRLTGGRCAR